METHGIRTEAEIFSGCITDMRNRLSDKVVEHINTLIFNLQDQDDMSFFNTNQIIETKVTNLFKKSRASFFEVNIILLHKYTFSEFWRFECMH